MKIKLTLLLLFFCSSVFSEYIILDSDNENVEIHRFKKLKNHYLSINDVIEEYKVEPSKFYIIDDNDNYLILGYSKYWKPKSDISSKDSVFSKECVEFVSITFNKVTKRYFSFNYDLGDKDQKLNLITDEGKFTIID